MEIKLPSRASLSQKSMEQGRNLISALFMGIRTAKMHHPANQAFQRAVDAVSQAATDLFGSTNGFSIKFVEDTAYLNRVRLRFDNKSISAVQQLRDMLETEGLGGLEVNAPPTSSSIRQLLLLFAPSTTGQKSTTADVIAANIGIVGVQRFGDGSRNLNIDRRVLAAQSYAKLILGLREMNERIAGDGEGEVAQPRIRAVRVVQDVVELFGERSDVVLELALNRRGGTKSEIDGANACLLSVAMGTALGAARSDLVDIGIAALFSKMGLSDEAEDENERRYQSSLARMLAEGGLGRSNDLRALAIAEHRSPYATSSGKKPPHVFARIIALATAFNAMLSDFGADVLSALSKLRDDDTGRFDPRLIDLLTNLLRAYPPGTELVLSDGTPAIVTSHAIDATWDRPCVELTTSSEIIDLMARDDVVVYATRLFFEEGAVPAPPPPKKEEPTPTFYTGELVELPSPHDTVPDVPLEPAPARPSETLLVDRSDREPIVETQDFELRPGRVLGGRYIVLEKIGEGGMSAVYRVQHKDLLKDMALKLLRPELSAIRLQAERLLREARAMSQLDDPNIVRVTDFGRAENNCMFLVMELLKGMPLSDITKHGVRMPIPWVVDIVGQILSGLAHAHENQLVHRDIKPENVMLVPKSDFVVAKLLDFGIAKQATDSSSPNLTREGAVLGTPRYMSPEQALGDPLDHRTDLYSTGVVLYQLLAGQVPFESDTSAKILARTISEPPPPLELNTDNPEQKSALDAVVQRALAKDPRDRFATATEFRAALKSAGGE